MSTSALMKSLTWNVTSAPRRLFEQSTVNLQYDSEGRDEKQGVRASTSAGATTATATTTATKREELRAIGC